MNLLRTRALKLDIQHKVSTQVDDITQIRHEWKNRFDTVFSNFCLYTIKDDLMRIQALQNIKDYLKPEGTFHIALPSEAYSAANIALQCLKDEVHDPSVSFFLKTLRVGFLVPYQWKFVLTPIAEKVHNGPFHYFSPDNIRDDFKQAGLEIKSIRLDYGGCGYHIHGSK